MTLNELIEQAQEFLAEGIPGDAEVLVMSTAGIVPVAALGDSLGVADPGGAPVPVVLVVPGQ